MGKVHAGTLAMLKYRANATPEQRAAIAKKISEGHARRRALLAASGMPNVQQRAGKVNKRVRISLCSGTAGAYYDKGSSRSLVINNCRWTPDELIAHIKKLVIKLAAGDTGPIIKRNTETITL